ncbi:MAG: tyrosine-protein phosphatase [Solirubrobacteraceae bacterium]
MIDLHCHVLPGLDDGPATLEDSLALCRAARAGGTRTLVATPHLGWHHPGVDAAAVHSRVVEVNQALRAARIDLTVAPGAEVALSRAAELSDGELGVLRLGGGPYVLIEFPWTPAGAGAVHALRAFAARGYRIVLAHPERTPMLQRTPALVRDLVNDGVLCCVSVRSLGEHADRLVRSLAWSLLTQRLAHAIASDAHDVAARPPDLGPALERAGLSGQQIDHFASAAPEAIIAGAAVPPPPPVHDPYRRRWFRRGQPPIVST